MTAFIFQKNSQHIVQRGMMLSFLENDYAVQYTAINLQINFDTAHVQHTVRCKQRRTVPFSVWDFQSNFPTIS